MLNSPTLVRGVATQGRHVNRNDLCCYQFVKKYKIMYSLDCVNFETVKDQQGNDIVSFFLNPRIHLQNTKIFSHPSGKNIPF